MNVVYQFRETISQNLKRKKSFSTELRTELCRAALTPGTKIKNCILSKDI